MSNQYGWLQYRQTNFRRISKSKYSPRCRCSSKFRHQVLQFTGFQQRSDICLDTQRSGSTSHHWTLFPGFRSSQRTLCIFARGRHRWTTERQCSNTERGLERAGTIVKSSDRKLSIDNIDRDQFLHRCPSFRLVRQDMLHTWWEERLKFIEFYSCLQLATIHLLKILLSKHIIRNW